MSKKLKLSKRSKKIPKSGIRKMFDLSQKYTDVVNLSIGEPDFDTPPHIIEAAVKAMKEGYTHYTVNAGFPEFRKAVSEKLRKENRIDADPETEIMATAGAMGGLSLAFLTLIDPGEEVLIPNPGFPNYAAQVVLACGKPISYPLKEENNFRVDANDIVKRITPKTKAILINSPSNPTGSVLREKELKNIANIALENDLLVISDEAYEAILYDEINHMSIASFPEMKERTISIFTFSKTYAMTGWRIGFAVAQKEIIEEMLELQEHILVHPSSISQMAAIAALRGSKDYTRKMLKEYAERREIVIKELNSMPGVSCLKPEGAFYAFPNIKETGMSSTEIAMYLLEKAKVITVPGTAFGEYGKGYIRISYSTSKEKIREAMNRMKAALEKLT
ncbi:MAG: pyridoxal phosphate-dependent aminotransferase [Candidatus Bathyarchaeota archaeon]|jgi:aspartate/methionine/tyrosine aminotransferase|nr:pyridoxal phosphate-dependent aminotransferase [Candidatus Bathyarchaeota archaeon]